MKLLKLLNRKVIGSRIKSYSNTPTQSMYLTNSEAEKAYKRGYYEIDEDMVIVLCPSEGMGYSRVRLTFEEWMNKYKVRIL